MEQSEKFVLPEVGQVGVVVRDIDKAINFYTNTYGIGPFRIFNLDIPEATLHGKTVPMQIRVALSRFGPVQLELVELPEGESIYHEFLETRGEGLHHLGFFVADIEKEIAKLERMGIGVLQGGKVPGMSFAYMDTEGPGGFIIELLQREPR